MSDFDYANARLRAMKSRLLSRRTLNDLAEVGSVPALMTALAETAYREAVQTALARTAEARVGVKDLAEALRDDLAATVGQASGFFSEPGTARRLAILVLRRYDVHNVKAILRGLARQAPADEILAAALPVAELRPADLAGLARAANVRAAIDLLATWRIPLAQPLLELNAARRNGGADVPDLELALERWHLRTALDLAANAGDAGAVLLTALKLQADATNVLTALRLVGEPGAPADAAGLFVAPGNLPLPLLKAAASRNTVSEAVGVLAHTSYGPALSRALARYEITLRRSDFERALAQLELEYAARLFVRDPLGIGVLVGYVALKTNEVANLRTLAQGLTLGEKPDRIRAEMLWAGPAGEARP